MRWFTRTTTLLLAFIIGVAVAFSLNKIKSRAVKSVPDLATQQPSEPIPLTKEIVSRSLQTHSFSTKRHLDIEDQIVWQWLKDAIATCPQEYLKLELSNKDTYGVVLYPTTVLEPLSLKYYNEHMKQKGLPKLDANKRYMPIQVYVNNIICPSWSGLIDVDEAKLVLFQGSGA